jgi:molecular chaperone DnaJ
MLRILGVAYGMSLRGKVTTRRQVINGKTYYQVLGVLEDAEDIVIRAAYKSLAAKYHPDKWSGDKQFANARMTEINIAHDCLSNSEKRRIYDEELKSSHAGAESKKFEDEVLICTEI